MPELRIDPVCGRRVYLAEDRAGRPSDYDLHGPSETADTPPIVAARRTKCPFCAGHEAATPNAVTAILDDAGQWRVRVVPNKFPAMSMQAASPPACGLAPPTDDPATTPQAALGVHEVIIESPDHVSDLTALSNDQVAAVLCVYRDRLRHWAADSRLRHGLVFKNSGFAAGASLEHVHSQLIATPYVPDGVQIELDGAERFFASHQKCVYCDLIEREIASGERLVFRQAGYAAICAFAGRQPYETWIVPERHAARFDAADDGELIHLAEVLQELFRRLAAQSRRLRRQLPYNLILHTGPFDDARTQSYHWHWEVIPRSAQFAGLELGAGTYINSVAPERAAQELRGAAAS